MVSVKGGYVKYNVIFKNPTSRILRIEEAATTSCPMLIGMRDLRVRLVD